MGKHHSFCMVEATDYADRQCDCGAEQAATVARRNCIPEPDPRDALISELRAEIASLQGVARHANDAARRCPNARDEANTRAEKARASLLAMEAVAEAARRVDETDTALLTATISGWSPEDYDLARSTREEAIAALCHELHALEPKR